MNRSTPTAMIVGLILVGSMATRVADAAGQKAASTKPAPEAAAPHSPPPPPPPPVPFRTEILRFDSWVVTCDDYGEPAPKHACQADLRISKADTGQVLLDWTFVRGANDDFNAVLQTPTGVMIANGVEIHFGTNGVRRIAFSACDPGRCLAPFAMDRDFLRDLALKPTVQMIVLGSNGQRVEFNVPLKGLNNAVAGLGQ